VLSVEERFWDKVFMCPMSGCWLWGGAGDPLGYGRFTIKGKTRLAHRVAYTLVTGIVLSSKMVLDHLCRNPACVNPAHLKCGTQRDNVHAPGSMSPSAIHAAKTVCPKCGGDYTQIRGSRRCRTCEKAAQAVRGRRYYEQHKAEVIERSRAARLAKQTTN
jgi:hypothetical protein